ncbi:hypothetical protein OLZ32_05775 [Rhizobium sp. 1AS11]|uniref:hypothetical protein n=1 Tax=Rhizobium acaciae TaxID=2989736 RepID=UPI0003635203|nr:hypothetical protein [Rhizobium acaciae]MCW1407393.1 hypothetical protein [Rhizobium acaciae]MCW1739919.1 hypothetical protein [Rhizobium acaciae]
MSLDDVLLPRATRSTFDLKARAGAGIEGIFDTNGTPTTTTKSRFRYNFPNQCRAIAETFVGDRIISEATAERWTPGLLKTRVACRIRGK